jgi:hypothetical protein
MLSERQLDLANAAVTAAAVLGLAGLGWLGWSLWRQGQERDALDTERYRSEQAIARLRPGVEELRQAVDTLTAHGLPHLTPVRTDKPIPIDQGFVSNIRFERADTVAGPQLRYQLVVHNTDRTAAYLKLDLLFYNDQGTEIGVSHLGQGGGGSAAAVMLERGEMDLLTAPIVLTTKGAREADIRYFKLLFLK